MKFKSKKQKVWTLLLSVVVVCGIAVGVMYATGVMPHQTEGAALRCECHTKTSLVAEESCGRCDECKKRGCSTTPPLVGW